MDVALLLLLAVVFATLGCSMVRKQVEQDRPRGARKRSRRC